MVEELALEQQDVVLCCRELKVSTSGYYAWQKRSPSLRDQGLCSAITLLMDDETGKLKSFIKNGDKVSFVFLTDEDDIHTSASCVKSKKEPIKVIDVAAKTYYKIGSSIRAMYKYKTNITDNGVAVSTTVATDPFLISNFTLDGSPLVEDGAPRDCTTSERAAIEKSYVSLSQVQSFISCQIHIDSRRLEVYDDAGDPCSGRAFTFENKTFTSLADYYANQNVKEGVDTFFSKTCTVQSKIESTTTWLDDSSKSGTVSYWTSDSTLSTPLTAVFEKLVKQKLGADSFQVTAIINTGEACVSGSGSTKGQSFIDMVQSLNTDLSEPNTNVSSKSIHMIQSICANEYNTALDSITKFTETMSLRAIPFEKNKLNQVRKTFLHRSDKTILNLVIGKDLDLTNGFVQLNPQVQLQDGDELIIELLEN